VSQATPLQTTDAVGFGISSDCADNETRYADDAAILTAARCIAENVLRPAAQDSDRMPLPNRANLAALGIHTDFGGSVRRDNVRAGAASWTEPHDRE
jgi:hypothetical protein